MESKPPLEARPPALIEAIAGLLIPPPAREHVLGDLCERYQSPGAFTLDVVRTVPFVLASQIRRTSRISFWPILVLMLTGAYGVGLPGENLWIRGLLPAVATLIGFMLRDAYRIVDLERPWREGCKDLAAAGLAALASQGVLALTAPGWMTTPSGFAAGVVVIVVLCVARAQNPAGGGVRPDPIYAADISLEALRDEIRLYERAVRRSARIEIVVGLVLVPILAAGLLTAPSVLTRVAAGVSAAGVLFVVWFIWRNTRTLRLPLDADLRTTAASYNERLAQNERALRTAWLWYLLPLGAGPAVMIGGAVATAPQPWLAAAPLLVMASFWVAMARAARRSAASLRRRIDVLASARDQA